MNVVVEEWIKKAEGDFRTANRECAADPPNYDAACYHAQQCIEKLLKAVLILRGATSPKTHDLVVLDALVKHAVPEWNWPIEDLRLLSRAAVAFRYPGETAGEDEAIASLRVAGPMRQRLLLLVGAITGA
jgi:HEPN domain-containing protein